MTVGDFFRGERQIKRLAASAAGLPAASLIEFIEALTKGNTGVLAKVPDITPMVISQGTRALQQAFADSFRLNKLHTSK